MPLVFRQGGDTGKFYADGFGRGYDNAQQNQRQEKILAQRQQEYEFEKARAEALFQYKQQQDAAAVQRDQADAGLYGHDVFGGAMAQAQPPGPVTNGGFPNTIGQGHAQGQAAASSQQGLDVEGALGRIRGVASQFSNPSSAHQYVQEKGQELQRLSAAETAKQKMHGHEAMLDTLAEMGADPDVLADPKIARRFQQIQQLAQGQSVDAPRILKLATDLRDEADQRAAGAQHAQENLSILADRHMQLSAIADAAEKLGDKSTAQRYRKAIQESRVAGIRLQKARSFEDADKHMNDALKVLSFDEGSGVAGHKYDLPEMSQGYEQDLRKKAIYALGETRLEKDPQKREVAIGRKMRELDPRYGPIGASGGKLQAAPQDQAPAEPVPQGTGAGASDGARFSVYQDAPGLLEPGNIDLAHRPRVENADGTVSSVRSIEIEMDGRHVLIPTVSEDGRIMSNAEAVRQYRQTGRHLGVYDSEESAKRGAEAVHEDQARRGEGKEQVLDLIRQLHAAGKSTDEIKAILRAQSGGQ